MSTPAKPIGVAYVDTSFQHYTFLQQVLYRLHVYLTPSMPNTKPFHTLRVFLVNSCRVWKKDPTLPFYFFITSLNESVLQFIREMAIELFPAQRLSSLEAGQPRQPEHHMVYIRSLFPNVHFIDPITFFHCLIFPRSTLGLGSDLVPVASSQTNGLPGLSSVTQILPDHLIHLLPAVHPGSTEDLPPDDDDKDGEANKTKNQNKAPSHASLSDPSSGINTNHHHQPTQTSHQTSHTPSTSDKAYRDEVLQRPRLIPLYHCHSPSFATSELAQCWFSPLISTSDFIALNFNADLPSNKTPFYIHIYNAISRTWDTFNVYENCKIEYLSELNTRTKSTLRGLVCTNTFFSLREVSNRLSLLISLTSIQWNMNMKPKELKLLLLGPAQAVSRKYSTAVAHNIPVCTEAFLWFAVRFAPMLYNTMMASDRLLQQKKQGNLALVKPLNDKTAIRSPTSSVPGDGGDHTASQTSIEQDVFIQLTRYTHYFRHHSCFVLCSSLTGGLPSAKARQALLEQRLSQYGAQITLYDPTDADIILIDLKTSPEIYLSKFILHQSQVFKRHSGGTLAPPVLLSRQNQKFTIDLYELYIGYVLFDATRRRKPIVTMEWVDAMIADKGVKCLLHHDNAALLYKGYQVDLSKHDSKQLADDGRAIALLHGDNLGPGGDTGGVDGDYSDQMDISLTKTETSSDNEVKQDHDGRIDIKHESKDNDTMTSSSQSNSKFNQLHHQQQQQHQTHSTTTKAKSIASQWVIPAHKDHTSSHIPYLKRALNQLYATSASSSTPVSQQVAATARSAVSIFTHLFTAVHAVPQPIPATLPPFLTSHIISTVTQSVHFLLQAEIIITLGHLVRIPFTLGDICNEIKSHQSSKDELLAFKLQKIAVPMQGMYISSDLFIPSRLQSKIDSLITPSPSTEPTTTTTTTTVSTPPSAEEAPIHTYSLFYLPIPVALNTVCRTPNQQLQSKHDEMEDHVENPPACEIGSAGVVPGVVVSLAELTSLRHQGYSGLAVCLPGTLQHPSVSQYLTMDSIYSPVFESAYERLYKDHYLYGTSDGDDAGDGGVDAALTPSIHDILRVVCMNMIRSIDSIKYHLLSLSTKPTESGKSFDHPSDKDMNLLSLQRDAGLAYSTDSLQLKTDVDTQPMSTPMTDGCELHGNTQCYPILSDYFPALLAPFAISYTQSLSESASTTPTSIQAMKRWLTTFSSSAFPLQWAFRQDLLTALFRFKLIYFLLSPASPFLSRLARSPNAHDHGHPLAMQHAFPLARTTPLFHMAFTIGYGDALLQSLRWGGSPAQLSTEQYSQESSTPTSTVTVSLIQSGVQSTLFLSIPTIIQVNDTLGRHLSADHQHLPYNISTTAAAGMNSNPQTSSLGSLRDLNSTSFRNDAGSTSLSAAGQSFSLGTSDFVVAPTTEPLNVMSKYCKLDILIPKQMVMYPETVPIHTRYQQSLARRAGDISITRMAQGNHPTTTNRGVIPFYQPSVFNPQFLSTSPRILHGIDLFMIPCFSSLSVWLFRTMVGAHGGMIHRQHPSLLSAMGTWDAITITTMSLSASPAPSDLIVHAFSHQQIWIVCPHIHYLQAWIAYLLFGDETITTASSTSSALSSSRNSSRLSIGATPTLLQDTPRSLATSTLGLNFHYVFDPTVYLTTQRVLAQSTVVTHHWVYDSLNAHQLLDPLPYLLTTTDGQQHTRHHIMQSTASYAPSATSFMNEQERRLHPAFHDSDDMNIISHLGSQSIDSNDPAFTTTTTAAPLVIGSSKPSSSALIDNTATSAGNGAGNNNKNDDDSDTDHSDDSDASTDRSDNDNDDDDDIDTEDIYKNYQFEPDVDPEIDIFDDFSAFLPDDDLSLLDGTEVDQMDDGGGGGTSNTIEESTSGEMQSHIDHDHGTVTKPSRTLIDSGKGKENTTAQSSSEDDPWQSSLASIPKTDWIDDKSSHSKSSHSGDNPFGIPSKDDETKKKGDVGTTTTTELDQPSAATATATATAELGNSDGTPLSSLKDFTSIRDKIRFRPQLSSTRSFTSARSGQKPTELVGSSSSSSSSLSLLPSSSEPVSDQLKTHNPFAIARHEHTATATTTTTTSSQQSSKSKHVNATDNQDDETILFPPADPDTPTPLSAIRQPVRMKQPVGMEVSSASNHHNPIHDNEGDDGDDSDVPPSFGFPISTGNTNKMLSPADLISRLTHGTSNPTATTTTTSDMNPLNRTNQDSALDSRYRSVKDRQLATFEDNNASLPLPRKRTGISLDGVPQRSSITSSIIAGKSRTSGQASTSSLSAVNVQKQSSMHAQSNHPDNPFATSHLDNPFAVQDKENNSSLPNINERHRHAMGGDSTHSLSSDTFTLLDAVDDPQTALLDDETASLAPPSMSRKTITSASLFENLVFAICITDPMEYRQISELITDAGGIIAPNDIATGILNGKPGYQQFTSSSQQRAYERSGFNLHHDPIALLSTASPLQHPSVIFTGVHYVIMDAYDPQWSDWFALIPAECGGGLFNHPTRGPTIAPRQSASRASTSGGAGGGIEPSIVGKIDFYGDGFQHIWPDTTYTSDPLLLGSAAAVSSSSAPSNQHSSLDTSPSMTSVTPFMKYLDILPVKDTIHDQLKCLFTLYKACCQPPQSLSTLLPFVSKRPQQKQPDEQETIQNTDIPTDIPSNDELHQITTIFNRFPFLFRAQAASPLPTCLVRPQWVRHCLKSRRIVDPRQTYLAQNYIDPRITIFHTIFTELSIAADLIQTGFSINPKSLHKSLVSDTLELNNKAKRVSKAQLMVIILNSLTTRETRGGIIRCARKAILQWSLSNPSSCEHRMLTALSPYTTAALGAMLYHRCVNPEALLQSHFTITPLLERCSSLNPSLSFPTIPLAVLHALRQSLMQAYRGNTRDPAISRLAHDISSQEKGYLASSSDSIHAKGHPQQQLNSTNSTSGDKDMKEATNIPPQQSVVENARSFAHLPLLALYSTSLSVTVGGLLQTICVPLLCRSVYKAAAAKVKQDNDQQQQQQIMASSTPVASSALIDDHTSLPLVASTAHNQLILLTLSSSPPAQTSSTSSTHTTDKRGSSRSSLSPSSLYQKLRPKFHKTLHPPGVSPYEVYSDAIPLDYLPATMLPHISPPHPVLQTPHHELPPSTKPRGEPHHLSPYPAYYRRTTLSSFSPMLPHEIDRLDALSDEVVSSVNTTTVGTTITAPITTTGGHTEHKSTIDHHHGLMLPFYLPVPTYRWFRIPFSPMYLANRYINGIIVCPTGLSHEERQTLKQFIQPISLFRQNAYTEDLHQHVTHVIVKYSPTWKQSPKVVAAYKLNIHVVSVHWLTESVRAGAPLDESFFAFK